MQRSGIDCLFTNVSPKSIFVFSYLTALGLLERESGLITLYEPNN